MAQSHAIFSNVATTTAAAPVPSNIAVNATLPAGVAVDPALWRFKILNRLELRLPALQGQSLSPLVGHLAALQTLILAGNGLSALPDTLDRLAELRFLDVSRNALEELPACVGRLKHLEVLELSENRLATLAPLAPLASLVTLNASGNAIAELLPAHLNFAALARLETLALARNRLVELPEELGLLQQLAVLNVADNAIVELPAGIADLKEKKIRELRLLPNPIADKKVLKILNKERTTEVVKELWKLLASGGGGGKKKGKR